MEEPIDDGKAFLHRQLVKLGDMMGDGLHEEPGGKWIAQEYKRILRALGIGPKRRKHRRADPGPVNERMAQRVQDVQCTKCNGSLKQVRSGSMVAMCEKCGAKFTLLVKVKKR